MSVLPGEFQSVLPGEFQERLKPIFCTPTLFFAFLIGSWCSYTSLSLYNVKVIVRSLDRG